MKDRVIFKVGSFVDFAGKTRQVVFCAVSVLEDNFIDSLDKDYVLAAEKSLFLGVSVQNPADDAKEALGKIIAEGKARKVTSRIGTLCASNKGMINTKVVEALLEQELAFFQQNPGVYLAGYNKDKELFLSSPEEYSKKYSK